MPVRRTRQFAQRRTPNRSWSGFVSTAPTAVPAATKVLLGLLAPSNPGIDETVLRNVGSLEFHTDQTASGESQLGAVGIIVITDIAGGVGAASIPGPITDSSDDGWLLYVPLTARFTLLSSVGVRPDIGHIIHFDSKAKRVVHSGYTLAIMVENAHASNAFDISLIFRTLSMVRGT